jgi:intracellular multiplication protein IcmO
VRQHITIPGTTGAGKTSAIVSLLSNALMQGSGFVVVDG